VDRLDFGDEEDEDEEDEEEVECEEGDEDCEDEFADEDEEEGGIDSVKIQFSEDEEDGKKKDEFPIEFSGYFSSEAGFRFEEQSPVTSESTTFEPPTKKGFGKDPVLVKFRQTLNFVIQYTYKNGNKSMIQLRGFVDNAYGMAGKENFDEDVLLGYEQEFEFGEVWKEGAFFDFADMKFGRQIIVWGEADAGSVTDILNPRDLREPFFTDPDEIKLPVGMVKLDFYPTLKSNLTVVLIPELRFHKSAPPQRRF